MVESLSTLEAEELIKSLRPFESIRAVGSEEWFTQHTAIEKLNMQAHYSAQQNSDEFVIEELQTHDKIGTLIQDLLVIDVWKEKVYTLLNLQEEHLGGVKAYMILFREALVVNLLEVAFYHRDAIISGGEMLIELAEYLMRKLTLLSTRPPAEWFPPKRASTSEALSVSAVQRHREQARQMEFSICITCLSLVRLICDQSTHVPPGVLDVFLVHQDLIALLIQLMETKPWIRREGPETLKFEDTQWAPVPPRDRMMVPKTEAMVWLALHALILDPECQRKYRYDDHRKNVIGRLRRYFGDTLFDQLPLLADLQRGIELLTVSGAPPDDRKPPIRIEQVPEVRSLLLRANYAEVAQWQMEHIFTQTPQQRLAEMRRLAQNYSSSLFEEAAPKPRCAACGRAAKNRCAKCRSEWYCDRECQARRWPDHKKACAELAARLAAAEKR